MSGVRPTGEPSSVRRHKVTLTKAASITSNASVFRKSRVVAMSNDPYESPRTPGETPVPKTSSLTGTFVKVLMVVGVVGLLIALFLPAVRTAREPRGAFNVLTI